MAGGRLNGADDRRRRRWAFAGCIFDEANWTLTVDSQRVAVETKPLELLRELLLHAGNLVSKDQLMDRIWPDVEVVEASLPTAIGKLRRALNDDRRDKPIIETVPRLGYRLAVPVEVEEDLAEMPMAGWGPAGGDITAGIQARRANDDSRQGPSSGRGMLLLGSLAVIAGLIALAVSTGQTVPSAQSATPRIYTKTDVFTALRKTDIDTMEKMLTAGWDPNAPLDTDSNSAINVLLNNCEWDRGHDRRQMLLAARTLIDGGARIDYRNEWGDTPYSIAKADRFCGPDHPVTKMIHMICYEGGSPIGDVCLADYKRDASGKVLRQEPVQQ